MEIRSFSPVLPEISTAISEEEWTHAWTSMTYAAQEILHRPSTLKPVFHDFKKSRSHLEFDLAARNIKFLEQHTQKYKDHPFFHELLHRVGNSARIEGKWNIQTVETVTVPNDDALRWLVYEDVNKYRIPIVVATIRDLKKTIQHARDWVSQYHSQHYFGIIIIENEDQRTENWFHGVPLLCSFQDNKEGLSRGKEDFVLMDSLGLDSAGNNNSRLYGQVFDQLHLLGLGNNLIYTTTRRQTYLHTGRTNARILLRNALLDLKHYHIIGSLRDYLFGYLFPQSDELAALPSQWVYHEDFPYLEDPRLPITHGFFSRTSNIIPPISKFRLRHQVMQFTISHFNITGGHLDSLFKLMDKDRQTMRLKKVGNEYLFSYTTLQFNDNYLLLKGWKDLKRIRTLQFGYIPKLIKCPLFKLNTKLEGVEPSTIELDKSELLFLSESESENK